MAHALSGREKAYNKDKLLNIFLRYQKQRSKVSMCDGKRQEVYHFHILRRKENISWT